MITRVSGPEKEKGDLATLSKRRHCLENSRPKSHAIVRNKPVLIIKSRIIKQN
jgi:hypothetical protein